MKKIVMKNKLTYKNQEYLGWAFIVMAFLLACYQYYYEVANFEGPAWIIAVSLGLLFSILALMLFIKVNRSKNSFFSGGGFWASIGVILIITHKIWIGFIIGLLTMH